MKIKHVTWKVALSALLIFFVFSVPSDPMEVIRERNILLKIFFSDVLCHFLLYGWLAFMVWWDYSRSKETPLSGGRIFIYCFLYSLFIEIYQGIIPWRSFELKDLLFNGGGILMSIFITNFLGPLYE
ncbi:MAG: VanZ family protein [Candidatus Aminicenantes bacterium]|nr:VanZ family protein [Candidatus Aminicenantes bacterium]